MSTLVGLSSVLSLSFNKNGAIRKNKRAQIIKRSEKVEERLATIVANTINIKKVRMNQPKAR